MDVSTTKHVHCYERYPYGELFACLRFPLEPDSTLKHGGRYWRPILVFRNNCLVMQRDQIRAYVVVPAPRPDPQPPIAVSDEFVLDESRPLEAHPA